MLRPTPGDPWGVEQHHWNTGAEENQQLNGDKPSSQTTVPDSISRYPHFEDVLLSSLEEADPSFSYTAEKPIHIKLVSADKRILHTLPQVNHMTTVSHTRDNEVYDADTEDISIISSKTRKFRHHRSLCLRAKPIKSQFNTFNESNTVSSLDRQPVDSHGDRQPVDSKGDKQPVDSQVDR